ncbi:MAG TPA: intein-containing Rv2578c family radical SAM protein [Actinomycetota bacterium]|nr:intein-containing Rv2578c family radical SAM protein [Actinomycetota bacterium]
MEQLFEIARRQFDTPEFRGITFIESEAKSIINKVPGNFLPFNWTINPYRGCSHACVYCMGGDTLVLMADGRPKPLAKIEAGDRIYGTEVRGRYRRYVTTDVLAHWETSRRAFRLTLEDGTELIASGDHRFLSNRGWKYVTGTENGADRRPFLTTNDALLGVGGFAEAPAKTEEYRRGYLTGMIRGDGFLGSYSYPTIAGGGTHHRFRLALVDDDGLQRTARYLALEGIETVRFLFQPAVGNRKALNAIRTNRGVLGEAIRALIDWPAFPSQSWQKGFLAGIYDAEGSCAKHILRISNTDPEILGRVAGALDSLDFSYVVEDLRRPNGCKNIRLLGGLRERLAFLHTVDPAIARKRSIEGLALKGNTPLGVVAIEDLGLEMPMYDITTGTGDFIANGVVSHNCFARPTHTYLDMDAGRDFETKLVVKINAPEVLRRELAAKRWKGEHIAMGTNTDPYQRAEGRYRLMRGILEALIDYHNPFSILTKGTLILRDLDLLTAASELTEVTAAFSIGTLDEAVWKETEPGTPNPKARIEAVRQLTDAGIPTGVLMAPVLPGISDRPEQLRAVVEAAIDAGATHVSPILLHLRPGVREEFLPWLEVAHPDLVARYLEMYRHPYGPKDARDALGRTVGSLVGNLGGPNHPRMDRYRHRGATESNGRPKRVEQLTLL